MELRAKALDSRQAALGDLLGVKGHIVNFVVRNVKKMVPAWDIPGNINFRDALTRGCWRRRLRHYGEECRVSVRNARRDANEMLKDGQKEGAIPEDDAKRARRGLFRFP